MHLKGIFFKVDLKILQFMSLFSLNVPKVNLDLVTHIGVQSIYKNIVFLETIRPIELKFQMETP